MATTPGSPSSGYWSTDEMSDISSFNFSTDIWLLSPEPEVERIPEVEPDFLLAPTETDERTQRPIAATYEEPEVDFKLDPESVFKTEEELELAREVKTKPEIPKLNEDHEAAAVETDLSLMNGSSSLSDFLFSDFLHESQPSDRNDLTDLDPDDLFPVDVNRMLNDTKYLDALQGDEYDLSCDPAGMWTEAHEEATPLTEETPLSDLMAEFCFDTTPVLSPGDSCFEDLPFHTFQSYPSRRPLSPNLPRNRVTHPSKDGLQYSSSSGCASPLDSDSLSSASSSSVFHSPSPDQNEFFDVLLCEVLQTPKPPSEGKGDNAKQPELHHMPRLVLVTSTTKRKSSDEEHRPRKLPRPTSLSVTQMPKTQLSPTPNRSSLLAVPEHVIAEVTSSSESDRQNKHSSDDVFLDLSNQQLFEEHNFYKTNELKIDSNQKPEEIKSEKRENPVTSEELCGSSSRSDDSATTSGSAASRKAEVLAAMLQAEGILPEPNRGSDVIFEELMNRRTVSMTSPNQSSSSQRGATSLRSFLIQKQRHSKDLQSVEPRQNLLHRLLKGQTSEAEVRREMAAREANESTATG